MERIITLKCPHCGANITFENDQKVTICKYCDSIIAVQDVNDDTSNGQINLREIVPKLQYWAYFDTKNGTKGGMLWITEHEVLFKPHNMNFGQISDRYIPIKDICGYLNSSFPYLFIYVKGKTYTLKAFESNNIINNIEFFRQQYYQHLGQCAPPLINISRKPRPTTIIPPNKFLQRINAFYNVSGFLCITTLAIIILTIFCTIVYLIASVCG